MAKVYLSEIKGRKSNKNIFGRSVGEYCTTKTILS